MLIILVVATTTTQGQAAVVMNRNIGRPNTKAESAVSREIYMRS